MIASCIIVIKLDESTARRQLKSPRSLSGRSIHLTLATKWSWSMNSTMKIHGKGDVCGQRSRSCLTFKIQRSRLWSKSNPLVTLRPGIQAICLLFVSWQSDHFWLRYRKFYIWPWKLKVKVMAKDKPDGHIWALEFNRYVHFSFRGNRTIFGWDIANSIFDLENSRSRSWPRTNSMVTFEP